MRAIIRFGIIVFCLVAIILCSPPPSWGQGWPQWGAKPWMADTVGTFITVSDTTVMRAQYKPANWWPVFTDGGLAGAITAATSGDGIIVYIDTLTEEVGNISKKLYIKSAYSMGDTVGGTVWDVTSEAFTLKNGSQGTVIEGFEIINRTNTDSLFDASNLNYVLRNCILDASKLVCAGDAVQSSKAKPYWENVKIFPRVANGFSVIADTLWCVNFQCGEPLFYDASVYYGPFVQGSPANSFSPLWHCRGKTNIYSRGTAVGADSDGVFCVYDGAIIASDTNSVSAISVTKGGAFTCYGGEILNNHHDKATVNVTDSGAVNIEKSLIKNKDAAGSSYTSVSTAASNLVNCTFGGQITAGAADIIDYKVFEPGPISVTTADSLLLWTNTYNTACILEYMVALSTDHNQDTLLVREKSAVGAYVAHVDTLFIADADSAGIWVGTILNYANFDDASIAAGNTLWLVAGDDHTTTFNIVMNFIPSYRATGTDGD